MNEHLPSRGRRGPGALTPERLGEQEGQLEPRQAFLTTRLMIRCAPTAKERAQIEHILKLADEAEEKGIGPEP